MVFVIVHMDKEMFWLVLISHYILNQFLTTNILTSRNLGVVTIKVTYLIELCELILNLNL